MELDQITKMHDVITQLDEAKNKVTITEFGEYLPLFKKDSGISTENATQLSNKFIRRFNPYENIEVLDPAGDTMITLPRLFTKVKAIDPEHVKASEKFAADAGNDVPKYAAEATHGLMMAISHTHHDEEYVDYVKKISKDYEDITGRFDRQMNPSEEAPAEEPQGDSEEDSGVVSDAINWE